jgi:hypothetical protein
MIITMISERVQGWTRTPAVRVSWGNVLWPCPSTGSDLAWRSLGGDEVEQRETKVGLEEEEDLDHVLQLTPTGRRGATDAIDDSGSHGGRGEEG